MIFSKKFVNDYTNLDKIDIKSFADKMVKLGNEYDDVYNLVTKDKLIIGKVLECHKHPESDHLHICKVDIKSEVLNIVCGAYNVKEGIKVIVALVGCIIKGKEITQTNILGYQSNGMLCSLEELGIDKKYLQEEDGIYILDDNAIVGENPIEYLELDDEIIDFELTANRADLLSMIGLAYESAILTNEKVVLPKVSYKENDEDISSSLKLDIKTDNVYTFLAKKAINIEIKESPNFIKNRLIACGIRPINNVVDISNYVMLETGQPLHFYDADKLSKTLGVKNAEDNDTVITLDNNKRILTQGDIVITSDKDIIGLAGVMGGLNTEVVDDTKSIVIEAAIFNPYNIRMTSKKILRSEASIRFEKGLDVNRTYLAMQRACTLLSKYASASICKGMLEYNTLSKDPKVITIKLEKINEVLGYNLSKSEVEEIFKKLNFEVKIKDNDFIVTVPSRRVDISIIEDLIEEVARVYGVDNIPGKLPSFESSASKHDNKIRTVKDKMVSLGLNEVVTYSLTSLENVFKFTNDEFGLIKVLDPMSEDRVVLRHSLLNSLLEVYNYNKARNIKDLSIFEVGKGFSLINDNYIEENKLAGLLSGTYTEGLIKEKYDFYVLKGIIEDFLDYLGYENKYSFIIKNFPEEMHPAKSVYIELNGKIIGIIGAVHPRVCSEEIYVFEINLDLLFDTKPQKLKYKEFSKFPSITKDMAFIISKNINSDEIIKTIRCYGGNDLKSVEVFDYYEGENIGKDKKSIAYSLSFEDKNKTLTDDEIKSYFEKIIQMVIKNHNAILRDK